MLDFFEDDAARAAGAPDAETPLSVTEFTRRVRALVENAFGDVRVRGEVSNLRIQSSGHAYFTLKDAGAQLSAVASTNRAGTIRSSFALFRKKGSGVCRRLSKDCAASLKPKGFSTRA